MFSAHPAKPGGNNPAANAEVEFGQARAVRQFKKSKPQASRKVDMA